jgi:hypothetical protein
MSTRSKDPKDPRSFGISVGGVLCAISALLIWRGRIGRAEILGSVGGVLFVLGLAAPRLLRVPNRLWWKFAHALAWFNTRLLLTLGYVLVFIPLGTARRVIGKDSLGHRRSNWRGWSPYPARYRDKTHYERMY